MSPPDRTTRPRAAKVHASSRGLLVIALCLGSVITVIPDAHGGAGRLSDAAKEAVKKPAEQRPLAAGDRQPANVVAPSIGIAVAGPWPGICAEPYPMPQPGPYPEHYGDPHDGLYFDAAPRAHRRFDQLHLGTVVAIGSLSQADFAPFTLYGVRVGTSDGRRTSLDLALLGGPAHFAAGTDIGNAFRDGREFGLDGSVRYSLTRPAAGLGIAPVAGFRIARLSWRYLNEIRIDDGYVVRNVRDDSIWHYSPYLGVGLTFLRHRPLDLGVTALRGWRFYREESGQGLENDLFFQDGYFELRLESRVAL